MSGKETALEMAIRAGSIPPQPGATPVIVDDVVDWHNRMVDRGRDVIEIVSGMTLRPPWPHTWLDSPILKSDESGYEPSRRVGIEIHGGAGSVIQRAFFMLAERKGAPIRPALWRIPCPENALDCALIEAGAGRRPRWMGSFLSFCDADWKRTADTCLFVSPGKATMADPVTLNLSIWAGIVEHVLGLFHVKNAKIVDRDSRQVRRQAARRGNCGVVVKELVIAPMRRTLRMMREAEQSNPGQPLPLHLCRGHFKTFTPERPLLGKFTGTFWWEPHLRGSEHMGVIVHDRARLSVSA